jgi:hypothetical protein
MSRTKKTQVDGVIFDALLHHGAATEIDLGGHVMNIHDVITVVRRKGLAARLNEHNLVCFQHVRQ